MPRRRKQSRNRRTEQSARRTRVKTPARQIRQITAIDPRSLPELLSAPIRTRRQTVRDNTPERLWAAAQRTKKPVLEGWKEKLDCSKKRKTRRAAILAKTGGGMFNYKQTKGKTC